VGGLEDEIGLAVLGGLALVAVVDGGVALHRLDAVQGTPLLGIELAGQDHLAVARLEVEPELPVARRLQLKFASHPRPPFGRGGPRGRARGAAGGSLSRNAEEMVLQVGPVRGICGFGRLQVRTGYGEALARPGLKSRATNSRPIRD